MNAFQDLIALLLRWLGSHIEHKLVAFAWPAIKPFGLRQWTFGNGSKLVSNSLCCGSPDNC